MLQSKLIDFAPLPLRVIAGVGFMIHGLPKILEIGKTQGSFMNMGLPQDLAILIGLLEFIGGLAILLGVFTRIAAGLFAIQMIGAIILVKLSKGFIDGFELDLLYLAIMVNLLITGPGFLSIEKNLLKREMFPKSPKYSTTTTNEKQSR